MTELKTHLTELSDQVSAKSALGKAVPYTLNHWSGLVETNVVER